MPWEVLIEAIKRGCIPKPGKLWALGCESITYTDLGQVKKDLSGSAIVLYEGLQPVHDRFTDPLVYVFIALQHDNTPRAVLLVQFKTHPMGDDDHFETNHLLCGTRIYQFGGRGLQLRLVSILCSDAFAFTDAEAKELYDRALVVHLQLNEKPRQTQYRQYRDRLLQFQGDTTELICLNWARDVLESSEGKQRCWKNIGASAWYLRPDKFDERDETLCANHGRGPLLYLA